MSKLSSRQLEILKFIRSYHEEHQFMPAVREIQSACDLSSTSVVDYNLRILQREGAIRRSPDISRGLELTDQIGSSIASDHMNIPVVGPISAGLPLPVFNLESWNSEWAETISMPSSMLPRNSSELFALRVKGTSMVDALVDDGDIVVLRSTRDSLNGDMVAAWILSTEETTLKYLYREGDKVRLQPANHQMSPIFVSADDVEIHGKVVAVYRNLG